MVRLNQEKRKQGTKKNPKPTLANDDDDDAAVCSLTYNEMIFRLKREGGYFRYEYGEAKEKERL